ncbi:MAG: hypothetical protein O2958_10465 [Gemmatimonadetes bacterium]|nr:hypothetical protein [Gemmatimonadota bacterium]MDA1103464.1 hypothetical protein [Gemmatimonadota bacterium]
MIRRLSMLAFALLIAAPLAAQAPAGMQMRVDKSTNANDPDDVPEVTITSVGSGFQVNTGPAVVVWNGANTATGAYNLSATFTLQQPSSHNNYYGLVYGGGALDGDSQNYLYFLIGQNGSYIVKHRAGNETVHDIQARTPNAAIVQPDASGKSVNHLAVRVGADQTEFVINGTVVFTAPKSGMAARSDGIYGVRVNHVIPGVLVEGLAISH